MEYVYVSFREPRTVFVDGMALGQTNQTLPIQRGHHVFTLSDPQDYLPATVTATIQNTTSLNPFPIEFH